MKINKYEPYEPFLYKYFFQVYIHKVVKNPSYPSYLKKPITQQLNPASRLLKPGLKPKNKFS